MVDSDDRIAPFDGLRGLAFLAVFMHHALALPLGWMGVDMFFVLSGFLITRKLLRLRSEPAGWAMRQFYLRRALRIVPPYYLALTMIYVAYPGLRPGSPWYFAFASNVLDGLAPALFGISREVGGGPLRAMWSIAVEAQFYLVWPWFVLLLPRRALPALFVALVAAAPLCRVLVQGMDRQAVYCLTPCRMDLLAGGALVAHIEDGRPGWIGAHRRQAALVAALSAGLFLGLTAADRQFRALSNGTLFNTAGYGLSTVFFTAVILYVRVAPTGPSSRLLRAPALRYVGRISYMTYLTHLFFLQMADARFGLGRWPSAALGLIATLSFSSFTWFVMEKPLSRLRLVRETHSF